MISIIVPVRNESLPTLNEVIDHLFLTATGDIEIIIVNDGSVSQDGRFKPLEISRDGVKVINNTRSRGVGYSFDRGVEVARAETIVLQGCDVLPKAGWHDQVLSAVQSNPSSIGCAACIGLKKNNHDLYDPENTIRYGADLLVTVGVDDLPSGSKLRTEKPNYTDLFKGRWIHEKKSDAPYEIGCLMGAWYFTTKFWYRHIGGFDTRSNEVFVGHRQWGALEPYISLKSWLCGGSLVLYPDIQAGHEFTRIERGHRYAKGTRSAEKRFWNKCFINETMVLDPVLREKIYCFILPSLNYNMARRDIQRHYFLVEEVRETNRKRFTRDLQWLMDKFKYKVRQR